jgi:hypothetical protein
MPKEQRARIKLRVENMDYDVVGGDFQQLLAAVKALPGRRYIGEQKVWTAPGSLAMVRGQLENSGFALEGGAPVAAGQAIQPSSFSDQIKIVVADFQAAVTGVSFQEMLAAIKAIPGRRFDGQTKQWYLPGALSETKAYFEKKGMRLEVLERSPIQPTSSPEADAPSPPPPPPDIPPPPGDMGFWEEDEADSSDEPYLAPDLPPTPPPSPATGRSQPEKPGAPGRHDQIKVIVGNRTLVVTGGPFKKMLAAVKEIPDRRFDPQTKQWLLPDDIDSIQQYLNARGFRLEKR